MSFEKIKSSFQNAKLGHALLFQGESPLRAREAVKRLAQLLFCAEPGKKGPCLACRHCRLVEQDTHPDLVTVRPAEDSEVIKIAQIRELVALANLKPFEARSKLFVIDPADAMNEEAQNAFLKTLEEPQGHTRFVLIARGVSALLETIRSRCQSYYFAPLAETNDRDESFEALKKQSLEAMLAARAGRPAFLPDLGKCERDEISALFDYWIGYFRDCLLAGQGVEPVVSQEEALAPKKRTAQDWGEDLIIERIEFLSELKNKLAHKVNVKLVTAALWGNL